MSTVLPRYTYRVEYSPDDAEYVALVAEFPSLSWLEEDPVAAMAGIVKLVQEVLDDMKETGETPPQPLADRRYSGKIALRTSRDQHRRLAIDAAEQGVSLNQLINQRIAAIRVHVAADSPLPEPRCLDDYGRLVIDAPSSLMPTLENAGPRDDLQAVADFWKVIANAFAPGFADEFGEAFLPGGRTPASAQVLPDATIMIITKPGADGTTPGFIVPNVRAKQHHTVGLI